MRKPHHDQLVRVTALSSRFIFLYRLVFLPPVRHVRHESTRTLDERR